MPDYIVVPKSALTATADAIKEKLETEEEIEFTQDGFKDAITTIETGGYDLDSIISGEEPSGEIVSKATSVRRSFYSYGNGVTSIRMPNCTIVGQDAFSYCTSLVYAYFGGNNFTPGAYMVRGCTSLKELHMPGLKATGGLGGYGLQNCTSLEVLDYGLVNNAVFNNMSTCPLHTIILRKNGISALTANSLNASTAFKSGGSGGIIYIPEDMYNHLGDGSNLDYKIATNWSIYDSYGTITWAKIEGSAYEL